MSSSQKVPGAIEPDLQTFAGQPGEPGRPSLQQRAPCSDLETRLLEGEQQSAREHLGVPMSWSLPTMKGRWPRASPHPGGVGESAPRPLPAVLWGEK